MPTVDRVQEGTVLTMVGPDDEGIRIFETSVMAYQSTRLNIPEDLKFWLIFNF
jgi:hypothetical protein